MNQACKYFTISNVTIKDIGTKLVKRRSQVPMRMKYISQGAFMIVGEFISLRTSSNARYQALLISAFSTSYEAVAQPTTKTKRTSATKLT
jgi:hypothetical protein